MSADLAIVTPATPAKTARELARAHTADVINALSEIVIHRSLDDAQALSAVVAASRLLLEYGWGKPEQAVTGPGGGAIEVQAKVIMLMPDNGRK